ncbi:HlyD family type I secretion periplasmic adaptor subunit [Desulforhopalus vacuolatus]|uniref:HlyD family type I secretion periplasmic adaptor subunit n=1 Tax=Desulforhopalus vacuolatus TaxID=40414 RepID=UPI001963963E|nr:HlyD family type I secretion periplasmic adaptor subunit [Desulforhopalus vacuolatus]MBM9521117.1 HlyD family type I secretion periplasmic adaptor subunit [Desulforhopalus vacuolatus]
MSNLTPEEEKILDTNPRSIIIIGLVIIVLFFGGLFVWTAFLPFYGAVIAPGTVKVSENKKVVQHLEGGLVDKIFVREGDEVTRGQVLIRLKGAQVNAAVSLNRGQLLAKLALAARLRAESRIAESVIWPEELLAANDSDTARDVMNKEGKVFTSGRRDILGKTSLYNTQIEQLQKQIEGSQAQLTAEQEIIVTLKDEILDKEELLKEKYIDKNQVLELKRRLSTSQGKAGSLKNSIAEGKQHIEEFKLRIVDLRNTYRENAIDELSKVEDVIFQLREQLRPMLDTQKRLEILAPMTGIVINMQIHSERSAVIGSGDPLLEIVPRGARLIIEASLRPDDITRVHVGQHTEVTLSAFDRRSTPRFSGVVDYVSADQITQQTPGGAVPYYVVHVVVAPEELKQANAYLYPGMPAVCYITTRKRTILSYLLEPFVRMTDNALRED